MVGHHSNTQGAGDFGLSFYFRSHFVRLMELGGDLLLSASSNSCDLNVRQDLGPASKAQFGRIVSKAAFADRWLIPPRNQS